MNTVAKTVISGLIIAGALAGCAQDQATWYEEKCLRTGFKQGTDEFAKCVDRDRKWDEATQSRLMRSRGHR